MPGATKRIWVDSETHKAIRIAAAKAGLSIEAYMRQLAEQVTKDDVNSKEMKVPGKN